MRDQAGYKILAARTLNHKSQLGCRVLHPHCGFRIRILRAIDNVSPVDQLLKVVAIETEPASTDVCQELGARAELRIVEFPAASITLEVLGIRRSKKGALVMVKPPV